jgi:hypothetical protein
MDEKTHLGYFADLCVFCGFRDSRCEKNISNTFYIFLIFTLFFPLLVMIAEKRKSAPDANRYFNLITASLISDFGLFIYFIADQLF